MNKNRTSNAQKIEILKNIFSIARTRELNCTCKDHMTYGRLSNAELDNLEKVFTDTRVGFPFIMGLVAITIAKHMESNIKFMIVYQDELGRQ